MQRLVRFGLNAGSRQPLNFILRIFNESTVFKGSFTVKGGNSGLVFPNDVYFIFSNDYEFTAPTPAEESKKENTYRTLLYVVLFLVFLFSFKNRI